MRFRAIIVAVLCTAFLAACTTGDPSPQPTPADLGWKALPSPDPRAIVLSIVACGGSWFAGGAVQIGGDPSVAPNEQQDALYRPAIWKLAGQSWKELPNKSLSYYGERAILRSMACNAGRIAAVGAASGGAHGNPRITTWLGGIDGPLLQNAEQGFELFGGPLAIGVGDITAMRNGFAITGNWLNNKELPSPAVWLSDAGVSWRRLPDLPELTSTPQLSRWANTITNTDTTSHDLLLVSGEERDATRIMPFLVSSADGEKWQRVKVIGEGSVRWADEDVVLVLQGNKVLSWREGKSAEFTLDAGTSPPVLTGALDAASVLLAGGCGGATCGVWWQRKGGGWQPTVLPGILKASPNSTVRLSEMDGSALLLLSDGRTSHLYQTVLP